MKALSKAEQQAQNRKIASGAEKHFNKKNVTLNGEKLNGKELVAIYGESFAASDAVDQLRNGLRIAVAKQADVDAKVKKVTASLKAYVIAHYGDSSPVLADFGFAPRKVATRTVETKMAAVEKQRATRAARHTMESRERAAIHGEPSSNVTPTPTPATVIPSPSLPAAVATTVTNGPATNGGAAP